MQQLSAVTLVVRDYDEAISWYRDVAGFRVVEDTSLGPGKRWVLVSPGGATGTRLLLAKADGAAQQGVIGRQTGGRVGFFLTTGDFEADHTVLTTRGVRFVETPRYESYGTVAVFEDLYGNRWDLIEPRRMAPSLRLALYQPDIPPNTGTLLRTAACFGIGVDIIEPCGFPVSDKALKRAGMDYLALADVTRHMDWAAFAAWRQASGRRLILVETSGTRAHTEFAYMPTDILMLGRETLGTPDDVAATCDAMVRIPMVAGARSLNVAIAGAVVLGEALRQTGGYPQ
jgi:tRNA (cytidine/uridine-2'-O-)-methyltransferase